jgi:hypothetical protein
MSFRSFSTELKAFAAVWKSLATALAESPAQPGRLHHDGDASSAVRLAVHR